MPTELLDLRLAFRALSDEDSDEGADDVIKDDEISDDDELEDADANSAPDDEDDDEEKIEE